MSAAPAPVPAPRHVDAPLWAKPHLRPGERVTWWGRPSLWGLVPAAVSTLAGLAVFFASIGLGLGDVGRGAALALPALIAIATAGSRLAQQVVKIKFTAYVVTDERFYAVTSFIASNVRSLPLSRLTTVSLSQGFIERAFGLWTAVVSAYGESGAKLEIPAMRDGESLLAHTRDGLERGANAAWLLKGD